MVATMDGLVGPHTQCVERPPKDPRVGFCHPQGRAHRHRLEKVRHAKTLQLLRQRVVPVAHHREAVAPPPERLKGLERVRQQNELQIVDQARREKLQRGSAVSQPLPQNRRAAPAKVGQGFGVTPLIEMFAIETHLRGKSFGDQLLGIVEALSPQPSGEPRHRRIESHQGSESIEEYGGGHRMETVTEPRGSRPTRKPSYTSPGVLAITANDAGRSRRTPLALAALPAAVAVAWAPSFVAEIYDTDGQAGTATENYLTRPDKGWVFLADAARLSRGARLGTAEDALDLARNEVWTGPTVKPTKVSLIYGGDAFRVAVPVGGTSPSPARAVAQPRSELSWLVTGTVRNGPEQPIGLIDYTSKRVVWNIRPLAGIAP